jgi:hypothetical protein
MLDSNISIPLSDCLVPVLCSGEPVRFLRLMANWLQMETMA